MIPSHVWRQNTGAPQVSVMMEHRKEKKKKKKKQKKQGKVNVDTAGLSHKEGRPHRQRSMLDGAVRTHHWTVNTIKWPPTHCRLLSPPCPITDPTLDSWPPYFWSRLNTGCKARAKCNPCVTRQDLWL